MTAQDLLDYIKSHWRATGNLPRYREIVEHFDGKVLNVLMRLSELDDESVAIIRKILRDEHSREANRRS